MIHFHLTLYCRCMKLVFFSSLGYSPWHLTTDHFHKLLKPSLLSQIFFSFSTYFCVLWILLNHKFLWDEYDTAISIRLFLKLCHVLTDVIIQRWVCSSLSGTWQLILYEYCYMHNCPQDLPGKYLIVDISFLAMCDFHAVFKRVLPAQLRSQEYQVVRV